MASCFVRMTFITHGRIPQLFYNLENLFLLLLVFSALVTMTTLYNFAGFGSVMYWKRSGALILEIYLRSKPLVPFLRFTVTGLHKFSRCTYLNIGGQWNVFVYSLWLYMPMTVSFAFFFYICVRYCIGVIPYCFLVIIINIIISFCRAFVCKCSTTHSKILG